MWYCNKLLFSVLAIVWFSKNSASIPKQSCINFLSNFQEFQFHTLKRIRELSQEKESRASKQSEKRVIGESGSLFVEASKLCLKNTISSHGSFETEIGTPLHGTCPYLVPITCNERTMYRTFDGSCNNLKHPYWGKANTPFRRQQAAEYADGIEKPRCESVNGGPLPGPRYISVNFHRESRDVGQSQDLSHLVMLFGQFLNHELAGTVTHSDRKVDCCSMGEGISCPNPTCDDCTEKVFFEHCSPIAVPQNDPYFSQFGKTCLPFSRTLPTPNLNCRLGPKEVLNSQTSYIDCSSVYGVSRSESNSLRQMDGGRLKVTPTHDLDLLLHHNQTFCKTPENFCFIAGDFRANQNFMIVSMHTVLLREHNRIARLLAEADRSLDDETLFQTARRVNIAEMQHITYKEYLPLIIGDFYTRHFGLEPLAEGYTRYESWREASLANAHSGAAFRFGHSTIRRSFSNGKGDRILLSPSFGLTDPFYLPGDATTGFVSGLMKDRSQEIDRFVTDQVVDKLFENRPGEGNDLAATNIMRGRDIGLKPYVEWRRWSGLFVPDGFDGLTDHRKENRDRLSRIYQSVHDIDLWTGGLSEVHLNGASVGPTFATIIAEQFHASKHGDRFWYEHDGSTRFSPSQLASIRKTTLSRIFCDNTHIDRIQKEPFRVTMDFGRDVVDCDSLAALDVCPFVKRWDKWGHWSMCRNGVRSRTRNCVRPFHGQCACAPGEVEIEMASCR